MRKLQYYFKFLVRKTSKIYLVCLAFTKFVSFMFISLMLFTCTLVIKHEITAGQVQTLPTHLI